MPTFNKYCGKLLAGLTLMCFLASPTLHAQIVPPDDFVGFKVGSDRKLFGWQTVVDYFKMLESRSDRVRLEVLGQTTLERPFVMAIISAPTNLMNLARYKNLQKQAASPAHLSEEDARTLARQNKLVVMVTLNVVAEEIASSQASIKLAHWLATGDDANINMILKDVIILLVPSLNPDGMQLVVDWYNQYLESPYEGSPLPVLSHHFAGRDIDRDWVATNLVETQLLARQLYQEWFPEIVYAQYPGLPAGPRMVLPLYAQSDGTTLHPDIASQTNDIILKMAQRLESAGIKGMQVRQSSSYWRGGSTVTVPTWHNMLGLMTAVAGAQTATPLHFPIGSLERFSPAPFADQRNSFSSWSGGWWRLSDIVETELAAIQSLLAVVAEAKESIIYNFCKMNIESLNSAVEAPQAYLVPTKQHDITATRQMLNALIRLGVEVQRVEGATMVNGIKIEAGDHLISRSQPFGTSVGILFDAGPRPRLSNGLDKESGNRSGWSLPAAFGVEFVAVDDFSELRLTRIDTVAAARPQTKLRKNANYVIQPTDNQSLILVNRLLNRRKKVYWLQKGSQWGNKAGEQTIFIPQKEIKASDLHSLAEGLTLKISQTDRSFAGVAGHLLHKVKLGLYRPWTANTDEGWTRFLLDRYEFPFKLLNNANVVRDDLAGDFDVIIIPDMAQNELIEGPRDKAANIYVPNVPKPFQGGVTERGVANLVKFVEEGGVLVACNRVCNFAIERFGLPVEMVSRRTEVSEFNCSEALLEVQVAGGEPLAFGMPKRAFVMFTNSPVMRPIPWSKRTSVPAFYHESNGPAAGRSCPDADRLQGLPAIMELPVGKGRVVLMGFKAQHLAETVNTFRFLFNAIYYSAAERVILEK